MGKGGDGTSGNRLMLVLLFLVSLVAVVAIIVAAVSLTKSGGETPSISVNGGQPAGGSSTSGSSNPIIINSGSTSGGASGSSSGRIWKIAIGHDRGGGQEYMGEKGYLAGLNKDIIQGVCESGGMDCRLIWDEYTNCWDSKAGQHGHGGQGLFNGWYDACAGWYATVSRVQVFDFSMPFSKSPTTNAFYVRNTDTTFDPTNISGKTIGFRDSSTADEKCLARQDDIKGAILPMDNIKYYQDISKAVDAVNSGEIDALFGVPLNFGNNGLKEMKVGFACVLAGSSMMTTKDSDFNSHWNVAFQKFYDSGRFSKLCREVIETHAHKSDLSGICIDAP